jgi:Na+-transporting NADH:ubiquinone oxidoreductase subunit C
MKQFDNKYIFIFSSVMVIFVAIFLSLAATFLQPRQEKNLEIEKKRSMLESIKVQATKANAEELYDKYIKESFVVNVKGEKVEGVDPFTVNLRNEQKKPLEEQSLPVFTALPESGEKVIIIPVEGKGLWGAIWGFVSLKSDMNTIFGVTFDHKGETPGLGAEINTTPFEHMFYDKKLFEDGKYVSIKVVKGGTSDDDPHGVDAISGGTITSKGLERMLYDGIKKYEEFFQKNKI